ncbi:MAG: hypothetical protein R6W90_09520 [Ignavibacteriaceae bacterium]
MKIAHTIFLTIIYALVVFSVGIYAQGSSNVHKKDIVQRAFKVFPPSLESQYPGIVESTIYNVILLKKYYPTENYSLFVNKLNDIAEESNDPALRYKAHLASIYLNFSERFDIEPKQQVYDREYLFKQISDQLGNSLAASK